KKFSGSCEEIISLNNLTNLESIEYGNILKQLSPDSITTLKFSLINSLAESDVKFITPVELRLIIRGDVTGMSLIPEFEPSANQLLLDIEGDGDNGCSGV